jgi:hypothetical protein
MGCDHFLPWNSGGFCWFSIDDSRDFTFCSICNWAYCYGIQSSSILISEILNTLIHNGFPGKTHTKSANKRRISEVKILHKLRDCLSHFDSKYSALEMAILVISLNWFSNTVKTHIWWIWYLFLSFISADKTSWLFKIASFRPDRCVVHEIGCCLVNSPFILIFGDFSRSGWCSTSVHSFKFCGFSSTISISKSSIAKRGNLSQNKWGERGLRILLYLMSWKRDEASGLHHWSEQFSLIRPFKKLASSPRHREWLHKAQEIYKLEWGGLCRETKGKVNWPDHK